MGLFTRRNSASESSSRRRPSVSSEAQAAELRARARRRLAGAIALVLAAVIVLPMLLDSEPVPVADDIPIRIPDRNTPYQPLLADPQSAAPTSESADTSSEPLELDDPASATTSPVEPLDPAAPVPGAVRPTPVAPPAVATLSPPDKPSENRPIDKPALSKPESKIAEKSVPRQESRSDDGAHALALLEGRASSPALSAKSQTGNFVLQVAAYTTQSDAQERRSKLHQAGVTNAFVTPTAINGKQQYRLRVGPFPSREAAQAAQARLRTLGYDNGFIAAQ